MKCIFTFLIIFSCIYFASSQIVDIPDPDFLEYLINEGVDTNADGQIQNSEAEAVEELNILSAFIIDFEGIRSFTNLKRLRIDGNAIADMIDISDMINLEVLDLSQSMFTTITAIGLTSLDTMRCRSCFGVTSLDLIGATSLRVLDLNESLVNNIDLTGLSSLETFNCEFCSDLFIGNIQDAPALKNLNIKMSMVPELDVSGLENLEVLDCEDCINLMQLDLTGANALRELIVTNAPLFTNPLDLSGYTELEIVKTNYSEIGILDVTDASNLRILECESNFLSELDVSNNTELEILNCSFNDLVDLDIRNLSKLQRLDCSNNANIEVLDVAGNADLEYLDCSYNRISELEVDNLTKLKTLNCINNNLNNLNVSQLVLLVTLNCSGNAISSLDVSSLVELGTLSVSYNQLTNIDISNINNLRNFAFASNQISDINLSTLDSLEYLDCSGNALTELDVAHMKILKGLQCYSNQFTELQINNMPDLDYLQCGQESLLSLTVTNCDTLHTLDAGTLTGERGLLESVELFDCPRLFDIYLSGLSLRTLDLSNISSEPFVHVNDNYLQTLFIKNGAIDFVELNDNPDLYYVCADEDDLPDLEITLDDAGLTDVVISSYCPHTFGGALNRVEGKNYFDADGMGCDDAPSLERLGYKISDGIEEGTVFSQSDGEYRILLDEGDFTITPILLNPSYFKVSPESLTVSFPADDSPVVQDFCVEADGVVDDVDIAIIPIEPARPGFETPYKIIYTNKGNTVKSGSVRLFYPAMLMDLILSNPMEEMETGNLIFWEYTDLLPFESREIYFTMRINSPMDDPPVNGDDILSFIASISINAGDDIHPVDNQDVFRQTVVNSYDPNDKTCLNGENIEPELVGEFIRYMIRFENTGTADAINIVVRDSIDPVAFDISTLTPLDASHPMRTQITGDIVEFIFENIRLPFEDETNDGYIVFKIKTNPDLVLGDVLENTAEIYFDYN